MRYFELRKKLESLFQNAGIEEFADIDWIICEVTGKKRSLLPFCGDFSEKEIQKIMNYAQKRAEHVPLAYIFGKVCFYGYDFEVNQNVLIPRIDTEVLVETLINDIKSKKTKVSVLDIGTGSGAIAVVVNKETGAKTYAVDVSEKALEIAKRNAKTNDAEIEFIQSDLFDEVQDLRVDFIVSNPPYIKTSVIETLESEVKDYEPILALDGGNCGLEFYKRIVEQSKKHLNSKGKLYFEIGFDQAKDVLELMQKDFCNIKVIKDYGGNDRVVLGELYD